MSDITLTPTWETGIYQLETTDPVMGGLDGISNRQAKELGNRTEYLKQVVDDHETRVDTLESSSTGLTTSVKRMKGSASLVRQGVVTSSIANGTFGFVSVAKISTSPIQNRITITASSASPVVLSFAAGFDSDGPITYYAYQMSNVIINLGNNLSGILYAELNLSTGALTWNTENTSIAPVVSYNDPGTTGYWYSLKDETLYRWSGSAWNAVLRILIGTFQWGGSGSFTDFMPIGRGIKSVCGRSDVPAGIISAFAGATAPSGFLLCNGGAISRSIYSELFTAIGTTYGVGDGSTTFNVPDFRGEFLRGLDSGRGVDLNSVAKTASITNGSATVTVASTADLAAGMTVTGTGIPVGATILSITSSTQFLMSANATATNASAVLTLAGRVLGSLQYDDFEAHTHDVGYINGVQGAGTTFKAVNTNTSSGSTPTTSTGGSETRPRNIAVNYIIKF